MSSVSRASKRAEARDVAKRQAAGHSATIVRETTFSGPLPHPDDLARYEEISPGFADRIVAMAERQSEHRRALEASVIRSESARSHLGMWFGLIVAITGIASGAWVVSLGHDIAGASISGATLATIVGAFVHGARLKRNDESKK